MPFRRKRNRHREVLNSSMSKEFNAVEIASILFCLHWKFNEKRDLNFVKTSRYIATESASFIFDFFGKLLDIDIHLVGSVVEGLNGPSSDIDFMCILHNGYCCDADIFRKGSTEKKVFLADCSNASPGYTLLWNADAYMKGNIGFGKPLKLNKTGKEKTAASSRMMALDNSELTEELLHLKWARNGPAITSISSFGECIKTLYRCLRLEVDEHISNIYKLADSMLGKLSTDQVFALPFHCKSILRNFIERKRQNNWPSKSLLKEIENIPAFVVPVGNKGSRFEDKEWRISYTLIETRLIKSLNEVQLLLLYQLKLVAKEQLVTICPDISSYVIKNLVLWIVECSQADYFQYKNFIPLYRSSLQILMQRILKGCMPNYMIPKRNLFEGRLSIVERDQLCSRLSRLIEEGLNISGTCSQIYKTVARQEIDILREQTVKERRNAIMPVSMKNACVKVLLSLVHFLSFKDICSGLMRYSYKPNPKIPADIPLD